MFMRNPTYLPDRSFGNQAFGIASIAAENARFMSRVYGWMTGGLCLTGVVAWNVGGNPQLVQASLGNRLLFWGLIIAQLGAVFLLSGLINRISGLTATLIYFLYAGLTGLTLPASFWSSRDLASRRCSAPQLSVSRASVASDT
jgi:FtsH-binding integral membrane protein